MPKSMIQEICLGNRGNYDKIKFGKEYNEYIGEAANACDKLLSTLTEEQKAIYNKLEHAQGGINIETALAYFVEGFKVGLRVGIECNEE